MKLHSIYYGITIWQNTSPGYRLRWTAGRLAANTLAGIRHLIRAELETLNPPIQG